MFKKYCMCGEKPVHTEKIYTMAGEAHLRYCEKCWDEKQESKRLQEEEWKEKEKVRQSEYQKQTRYEYLKREIELIELEKKAKELGI